MKAWFIAGLVVLVLIGAFGLYRSVSTDAASQQQGPARRPPLVEIDVARRGSIAQILETTAEIVATNSVTIRASIEGPIAFLPWREGDIIEKTGQKLVEIERSLYRQEVFAAEAALAVAEASLADLKAGARDEEVAQAAEAVRQLEASAAYAESNKERVESLVATGAIPGDEAERARLDFVRHQTELASARERLNMLRAGPTATTIDVQRAKVREARARLALARARLDECTINAPFAGTVSQVFARPGDLASVREPLLRLLDNDSLVVRFGIPENQAAGIRAGDKALIRLDSMPGRSLEGRVERLFPEVDRRTRTRTAEAVILDAVDLVPGLFARIDLPVRSVDGAVIVPDRSVLTTARGERILFVHDDGRVRRRLVTMGIEQGEDVQILEGVDPGEKIIVAGHENLRDGAEVRVSRDEARSNEPASPSGLVKGGAVEPFREEGEKKRREGQVSKSGGARVP